MVLRALARVGLLLGICGAVSPAAARAPILPGLSWVRLEGAESCISAIALAQQIEHKLGRSVFVPTSAAELTIEGYVAPRADVGFVAHLAVVAPDGRVLGTRVLETLEAACNTLDQALVLVIAVTLNPDTGAGGVSLLSAEARAALDRALGDDFPVAVDARANAAPPAARVPVPRPAADRDTVERPPAAVAPDPDAVVRLDGALIGGGGMLPSPAFGIELGAAVMPRQWLPLAFHLQAFAPSSLPSPTGDPGDVTFMLFRASTLLCPQTRYGQLSIEGCVGGDTGIFYVTSSGFIFDGAALRPVLDVVVQPNVRIRLGRQSALRFGFSFGFPVLRPTIQTRQSSSLRAELFGASAITVALHAGVSLSL